MPPEHGSAGVGFLRLSLVCPQRHADNLKCSSVRPQALFGAARFTVQCVRAVGQDVSPSECVLLSNVQGCCEGHESVGCV